MSQLLWLGGGTSPDWAGLVHVATSGVSKRGRLGSEEQDGERRIRAGPAPLFSAPIIGFPPKVLDLLSSEFSVIAKPQVRLPPGHRDE